MRIERAAQLVDLAGADPFDALAEALEATGLYPHCLTLFDGKIVDVERETRGGFSVGKVTIDGFAASGRMEIAFQNENLVATSGGKILAMVPDIITVMDRDTADTITTEKLKYGQRVKVIAAAAPDILRDDHALSFVGPRAFGMGHDFAPVEQLNETETA
ncbi:MAG: S-methyl thiohydantoin desulfurase domain-containing protein [Sphingopyxis sp.]